jgi:hypothetical protein
MTDAAASSIPRNTARRLTRLSSRSALALIDFAEFFLRRLVRELITTSATRQVALVDSLQLVAATHLIFLLGGLYNAVFVEAKCPIIRHTLTWDKDRSRNAFYLRRSFQNIGGRLVADTTNSDLLLLKQLLLELMLILRQNTMAAKSSNRSCTDWRK